MMMWRGFDGMLNCHQEFAILWSDLVVLFLKVDSCGNGWVPPGLTNTGITVRFVCINYYALPRFVMSFFHFCCSLFGYLYFRNTPLSADLS